MFRRKQKLDNIYNLLINFNNNERKHSVKLQTLMDNYKEDLQKVMSDLEHTKKMLDEKTSEIDFTKTLLETERKTNEELRNANKELNREISRLTGIVENDRKFKEKIENYWEKVVDMAKNTQKEQIKKKPTRAELMAEKYYKIPDDAMSKLK